MNSGPIVAVDRVDLEVARGELFALLGGSGCGKTTLLRMLAGFETPDAGRLFIDGQDMTDVPPYRRPVNMMFQSYALFPHMDVAADPAVFPPEAMRARFFTIGPVAQAAERTRNRMWARFKAGR